MNTDMENIVAAIDLGTSKTVVAVGEKTEHGVRIIGYGEAPSEGIVRGEPVNIQKAAKALGQALQAAERQTGIRLDRVWCGIGCEKIHLESITLNRHRSNDEELISAEEISRMLEDARNKKMEHGQMVLHAEAQSFNIDDRCGETDPVGMVGSEIEAEYKLFTGRKTPVSSQAIILRQARVSGCGNLLRPIAAARAVLSEDERELGVALLDIGGGTSDLIIIQDRIVRHICVIPFGGNSVTEDIRQLCGVSLKTSEQLKVRFGSAYSAFDAGKRVISIPGTGGAATKEILSKDLARIIEARMAEILKTVSWEIRKAGFEDGLRAGLVITGGGANLMHIQKLANQLTGSGIRIALPMENILGESCDKAFQPASSTAVGLVLSAFDLLEQTGTASGFTEETVSEAEAGNGQPTLFPEDGAAPEKPEKKQPEKPREKKSWINFKKTFENAKSLFDDTNDA